MHFTPNLFNPIKGMIVKVGRTLATETNIPENEMEVIEKEIEQGAKVVSVKGRLDGISASDFEKQLLGWIDAGHIRFIIDLGELDYISSAGLRGILGASKELKTKNGKLILCALKDSVKEVFDISGFKLIIPVCESLDSAIEKL